MASEIRTLVDNGTDIYPKTVASAVIMSDSTTVEDSVANSVKYIEQGLTDSQKAQARNNIGAQPSLISGTNIKTVNNTSLLGSGNIDVENVFVAEYQVTTYQQVADAYNAGKFVVVFRDNGVVYKLDFFTDSAIKFTGWNVGSQFRIELSSSNTWTQESSTVEITGNKKSSWSTTPNNTNYPTEKLVKDTIDALPVIPSGGTAGQVLTKTSGTDHDVEWTNVSSGPSDVFWATYGITSFNDISASIIAGKLVMLNVLNAPGGTQIGVISDHDEIHNIYMFTRVETNVLYTFAVDNNDSWSTIIKPLGPIVYRGSYSSTLENWSISTIIRDEIISFLKDNCIVYLKDTAGGQTTIEMITFYCEDTDELLTSTGHVINTI